MKRVVVTGMAGISTLGNTPEEMLASLRAGKNATQYIEEWQEYHGLRSLLYAKMEPYETPKYFTRKNLRTMSTLSVMAVDSTRRSLEDAGLLDDPILQTSQTGVAYGSCTGSVREFAACHAMMYEKSTRELNSGTYVKMMGHTAAVNISLYFGTKGRIINSGTACTSGSLAIGQAYESIVMGRQTVMLAGGAEVFNVLQTAVFDTLFAASTRNDRPELTPAPYDAGRDGLVLGEGACTLVLEELEHALARGARIYAEVVGFGFCSDGLHITSPNAQTMKGAMIEALEVAQLSPADIDYISLHGTGTINGDKAEAEATRTVFTEPVPASSLKSYTGHTLGACGALESMVSILMMHEGWFHPNLNLRELDPDCAGLDLITGEGRCIDAECVMNNNYAFGGINTSLIFRKWKN